MGFSTTSTDSTDYDSMIDIETYTAAKNDVIVSVPGKSGISGWVFDVPTGESIESSLDITDHYVENGSFLTDHAVLKAQKIMLSGFVGNLVYKKPQDDSFEYTANQIANRLAQVDAYLPEGTTQAAQNGALIASQAEYIATQYKSLKSKASNVVDFFSGKEKEPDAQTIAYHELKALQTSKQIVSVQTYWEFFPKMMIETISASHDDTTNSYTNISITLKEIRTTGTLQTSFDSGAYTSAIDLQNTDTTETGTVKGEEVDESVLYSIFGSSD